MVDLPTGLPSVEGAGIVAAEPVVAGTRSWVSGTALRSAVAASALAAATTRVAAASIAAMVRVRDGSEAGRGCTSKAKRGPPVPSSTTSSGRSSTSPPMRSPLSMVPLLELRSAMRK